jgi:hypothetical protein
MKKNAQPQRQGSSSEQGSSMVLAIIVLVILSGMGGALLFNKQAFYLNAANPPEPYNIVAFKQD